MYKVVLQDCRASCIWLCMVLMRQLKMPVWKEWNEVVPFLSLIQLSLTCSTCTCMVNEAIVVNYTTKCWSNRHAVLCVWQVKLSVILTYCKACVYWMAGAVLLMNCILNGFAVASNFWLADWSNAEDRASPNSTVDMWVTLWISNEQGHFEVILTWLMFYSTCRGYYLSIFSVLGFGQAFFAIFAYLFLVLATIKGSSTIHSKMLTNILRSPMSFFDTTPLGRILNRFSKDIYNIDEVIPKSIDDFLAALLMVVSVILVVSITTPVFIVVILPLGIFYWFVQVCSLTLYGLGLCLSYWGISLT